MHFTRESIFVSTIRSFCVAFAGFLGVMIALVIAFLAIGSTGTSEDMLPQKAEALISVDANGERHLLPLSSPAILRIDIHGVIGEGDLTSSVFENLLLDSRNDFLAHDRVKAVILHFDTPGGLETDSTIIYQLLMNYKQKYKVPIYGFVEGLCASGGMYIASACDKIYASSCSTIGSVGVLLGPAFNFSQAMEKWGIQSMTFTQGKDKDMLNPFRPWVPGEDDSIRAMIAASYMEFVDVVTKARPMLDKQKLINEYGAQVYTSAKAQELGYIDVGNSQYSDALKGAVEAAKISPEEHYQVVQLNPPKSIFKDIFTTKNSLFQGKIIHTLQINPNLPPEFSGKLLYLYLPHH